MLAASGCLSLLLHHDGHVGLDANVAAAHPGEDVRVKGELVPWAPPTQRPGWAAIAARLDNHTYVVEQPDEDLLVLVTSGSRLPAGTAVVDARIRFAQGHPQDPGSRVLLLGEPDVTVPLVFR